MEAADVAFSCLAAASVKYGQLGGRVRVHDQHHRRARGVLLT